MALSSPFYSSQFSLLCAHCHRSLCEVVLVSFLAILCLAPRLVVICRGGQSDKPSIRSNFDHVTTSTPLSGGGMPNHVGHVLLHAMDGSELSPFEPKFNQMRLFAKCFANPVQPLNSEFSGHGPLWAILFPGHSSVHIPTVAMSGLPVRCLRCFTSKKGAAEY